MLLFKFFVVVVVVDFLIHVINGVMEAKRRTQNVRPVQSFFFLSLLKTAAIAFLF